MFEDSICFYFGRFSWVRGDNRKSFSSEKFEVFRAQAVKHVRNSLLSRLWQIFLGKHANPPHDHGNMRRKVGGAYLTLINDRNNFLILIWQYKNVNQMASASTLATLLSPSSLSLFPSWSYSTTRGETLRGKIITIEASADGGGEASEIAALGQQTEIAIFFSSNHDYNLE